MAVLLVVADQEESGKANKNKQVCTNSVHSLLLCLCCQDSYHSFLKFSIPVSCGTGANG